MMNRIRKDAAASPHIGNEAVQTRPGRLPAVPVLLAVILLLIMIPAGRKLCAAEAPYTARPSVDGALHVEGTSLVNEAGRTVILRGLSTHGLTWYPEFVDETLFRRLQADWNCSLIRLAMYSSIYCSSSQEKENSLALLKKGIDAAIAADTYVIADWHILEDSNPLTHKEEAAEFFSLISEQYADAPNLIYEICNEPNGGATWEDIRTYAEEIIPVIRANDPDAVILVGTPDYDMSLMAPALDPLSFDQVMYACHFYAGTHYDALQSELKAALGMGLPVFVTECGLSEASGDGKLDPENAASWFSLLQQNGISYTIWSICDKDESSALFLPEYEPSEEPAEPWLSSAGLLARSLIRGEDPDRIRLPEDPEKGGISKTLRHLLYTTGRRGMEAARRWPFLAAAAAALVLLGLALRAWYFRRQKGKPSGRSYDTLPGGADGSADGKEALHLLLCRGMICLSTFFTLVYLMWRVVCSVPFEFGWPAVVLNLILLAVELLGFCETLIHFISLLGLRKHPLPVIDDDEYPEVDIFIATYNEPVDLLRRTAAACTYLKYPDKKKVHVWICDDNRRAEMRALAQELGVGYFDRPDHQGAKAGNLNHAMSLTHAPYIVTLDADMIPRSDFLLKTIPYFVDAKKRAALLPEGERAGLGFVQTPQSFYTPDIFQHALYCEHRACNEQDFFYRTLEEARTTSNSVIYGGSNTVLSREALESIGGFYTESITEDFATGLLIEAAGYVSLGLSEPLASGRTPDTFREHVQQRIRWGRGVIATAKKLRYRKNKGLSIVQKLSYWSSITYWYSPVKNLIYILMPLMFAVFGIPVFRCSWLELLQFWLPFFLLQDLCLKMVSTNTTSTKWSGIYGTCVMPLMLVPIIKESLGITLSVFKVTDKSLAAPRRRTTDRKAMAPFLILIALSVAGIVRICFLMHGWGSVGLVILLYWMIRNMYFLLMSVFLINGRDRDGELVHVYDAEQVTVRKEKEEDVCLEGVTTHLTEHGFRFFLDEGDLFRIGDYVHARIRTADYQADVSGVITGLRQTSSGIQSVCQVEILDYGENRQTYLQILYDRIPTLPQNLNRDLDIFRHMWVNIARRAGRVRA